MAIDFSNMLSTLGGDSASTKHYIRKGGKTIPLWYKIGGLTSSAYPAEQHFFHRMCSVLNVDSFSAELLNETETQELGKTALKTNDGTEWTGSIEFKGDEILTLMAMVGQPSHNTDVADNDTVLMNAALNFGGDFGVQGHLILVSADENDNIMSSQLITEVGLKLTSSPGGAVGSDSTYTVELYSKGEVYQANKGSVFVPFLFLDDGTITNVSAPDGILTDFAVKNANGAFSGAPAYDLQFQRINYDLAGGANPEQYIVGLRNDETLVSSSSYTVTQDTGTISFTVAPADGAKIEGICLMASGFETWVSGNTYFPGDVVYNGTKYWKCHATTSTSEEPTGTPLDWTDMLTNTFEVPYYSYDAGGAYQTTSNRLFPFFSWLSVQHPTR